MNKSRKSIAGTLSTSKDCEHFKMNSKARNSRGERALYCLTDGKGKVSHKKAQFL